MKAPEQMLKKELVPLVRDLQQQVKILTKQLEEKKDDKGEIKGDLKAPVFYFDDVTKRFITAVANVNLNQLSEIQEHGTARHMAEHRCVVYCEDEMFLQRYEGDKNE